MLKNLKRFLGFDKVRIVYTLGKIQTTIKEYNIHGKKVIGCEVYDVHNKPELYQVRWNKVNLYVPLVGKYKPFSVLSNGELAPVWNCKGKGKPLDYVFWIPFDYEKGVLNVQ